MFCSGARMILTLANEQTIAVEDAGQAAGIIRAALESSADQLPLIVSIDGLWDLHIGVGLAAPRGTIQVQASSRRPPYWVTSSPEPLGPTEQTSVDFFLHGRHYTELPAEYLIPAEKLWPALQTLLINGLRSTDVAWREV